MHTTQQTLKDLSFSIQDTEHSIISLIDRCHTFVGSELLRRRLSSSPSDFAALKVQQEAVQFWAKHQDNWPKQISNGTIVMVEKFYESADVYSGPNTNISIFGGEFFQKLFNRNEYHFTQFSLSHLSDFLRGCQELLGVVEDEKELPELLLRTFDQIKKALDHSLVKDLVKVDKQSPFKEIVRLSFRARREMKSNVLELIQLFAQLDVWYGMAKATIEQDWQFPQLLPQQQVCLNVSGLYHPLLEQAVRYSIDLSKGKNFILLTGANMSGKTTFMRALGVATILAHLGMGVPAYSMQLSFLEGVMTNMHVEDDLFKGESFFLAEINSIKQTVTSLVQSNSQLVLMDELFKGTNVHDAYECTKAIVEGLLQRPNHIMVLSTHLHELAHHFEHQAGIDFYCFHTLLGTNGTFQFNYLLEPGISDERIGYKILVKEGIIELLKTKQQA